MTIFTGFFKSAGNEGIFIGAIKGDGFEIVLETRTPDKAEAALRELIPVEKASVQVSKTESLKTLPCNEDDTEEEIRCSVIRL